MSYNDFLATVMWPEEKHRAVIDSRKIHIKLPITEYDTVRFGLPKGTCSFEKLKSERELLLKHYYSQGYDTWPYSRLSPGFRKHVALFRASLDLWEQFSHDRAFSKEELYVRCLREGHAFTEYIKKARSTSLRAMTSETDTVIDEDYYVPTYKGYNSIMHERYLIHWDDTESVDDVKYAFLPLKYPGRKLDDFRQMVKQLFEDFRIGEETFPDSIDMLGALKNTKMYDPKMRKTALMREFWTEDIDLNSPWFAKRVVVPTDPGSTRDTGVGDPATILKVKQINSLARVIHEKLPYSANTHGYSANARYKRVLKKNAFLHLDFKKFGLTFPRSLMNIMIEEISLVSGIDTRHLDLTHFYVEIDKEVYETTRGTMLGWMDSLNSLCVIAILHSLATQDELKFDFVTFNDDVEISKRVPERAIPEIMELLRSSIITKLASYDIGISIDKTYASKASVFLERYAYFDREYGLDMYKEQLTVASYARSLVTEFPWQAKLFYAAAEQWTKSAYATDRCIDTCPVEFRKEEVTLPLWAGGWRIIILGGLDQALRETDELGYFLGIHLSMWKQEKYSIRREKVSTNEDIWKAANSKAYYANSAELGKEVLGMESSLDEINVDIELIRSNILTYTSIASSHNEIYATRILRVVEKSLRDIDKG